MDVSYQKVESKPYSNIPFSSSSPPATLRTKDVVKRRLSVVMLIIAFILGTWLIIKGLFTPTLGIVAHCGQNTANITPDEFDWFKLQPSTNVNWTPCFSGHLCARLLLPLDYTNASDSRTTAIALQMVPSPLRGTPEYRGTVLVNPGGPGGSGTYLVKFGGQALQVLVGDSYDVLGFDPRGVGKSTPGADCFTSSSERAIWETQMGHRILNASDDTLGVYRAREQVVGARCEAYIGGEGGIARFMSSASVARDMLEISQKLGQDKVNYMGFSYGTVLGQYFAAMFPDKVGRFVIDGVLDADLYRSTTWGPSIVDMEESINSLFTRCHEAGPEKCPIYEASPKLIRERYYRVREAVKRQPVAVPALSNSLKKEPFIVTDMVLNMWLIAYAYSPVQQFYTVAWSTYHLENPGPLADASLAALLGSNPICQCGAPPQELIISNEAFYAIACGDGEEIHFDRDAFSKLYAELVELSPTGGPVFLSHNLKCTEWSATRPVWRFEGPFAAPNGTATPMLVVQPRYDPVCPLRDARAVHARYAGAGLLVQNSHGHCSISAPSLCTMRHVRAYYETGVVPKEGTVCEVDELPFVGLTRDVSTLSQEDNALLEAARELSSTLPMVAKLF